MPTSSGVQNGKDTLVGDKGKTKSAAFVAPARNDLLVQLGSLTRYIIIILTNKQLCKWEKVHWCSVAERGTNIMSMARGHFSYISMGCWLHLASNTSLVRSLHPGPHCRRHGLDWARRKQPQGSIVVSTQEIGFAGSSSRILSWSFHLDV